MRCMKRSDIEQRAAPKSINQPQPDKSKDQIGHPDAHRLQERGLGSQTGQFKDPWSEI